MIKFPFQKISNLSIKICISQPNQKWRKQTGSGLTSQWWWWGSPSRRRTTKWTATTRETTIGGGLARDLHITLSKDTIPTAYSVTNMHIVIIPRWTYFKSTSTWNCEFYVIIIGIFQSIQNVSQLEIMNFYVINIGLHLHATCHCWHEMYQDVDGWAVCQLPTVWIKFGEFFKVFGIFLLSI